MLVAAPGRLGEGGLRAVDPDDAGAQFAGDPLGALQILRHHRGGQAEAGIVGRTQGLCLVIERSNAHDRTEDFFLPDPAVFRHIGKDGGLQVEALVKAARTLTAGDQSCPLFTATGDGGQHLVVLCLVHQRTEQHALFQAMADTDLLRLFLQALEQRLVQVALDQHARRGGADLALVPEDAEHDPLDSSLDVAVGEDDEGRLAAQLQADVFDVAGGGLHDAAAGGHAAGEGQLVDARVLGQRCAGVRAHTGHHVEHARGQPGLVGDTRQFQGSQRGQFGRFQHHAAAGSQGRGDFPGGHQHGEVPGDDRAGHAHRLFAGQRAEALVSQGHGLLLVAVEVLGQIGIEVEAAGGVADIPERLWQRLAVITDLQFGQLLLAVTNTLGNATQHGGASGATHLRPGALIEGSPGSAHRQIDVIGGGGGNAGNQLFAARVDGVEGATFDRGYPLAIDVELVVRIHASPPIKAKRLALKGVRF
ncbi:hypothetical protein FQZ97_764040 [compost metagenome]